MLDLDMQESEVDNNGLTALDNARINRAEEPFGPFPTLLPDEEKLLSFCIHQLRSLYDSLLDVVISKNQKDFDVTDAVIYLETLGNLGSAIKHLTEFSDA